MFVPRGTNKRGHKTNKELYIYIDGTLLIFSNQENEGKIFQAQDHLGIIYKRFLKQLHGWKAASGYVLSHMYFLSLLRENASRGMKHHRTRIFTK